VWIFVAVCLQLVINFVSFLVPFFAVQAIKKKKINESLKQH
jgi:hypothetical protein